MKILKLDLFFSRFMDYSVTLVCISECFIGVCVYAHGAMTVNCYDTWRVILT